MSLARAAQSQGLLRAVKLAKQNPIKKSGRSSISRFACILDNGYTTIVGFNSYKSHPLQAKSQRHLCPEKIHLHAEVDALAQLARMYDPKEWSRFKMYVARVYANGEPANAEPCEGCTGLIQEFNIKHMEFT